VQKDEYMGGNLSTDDPSYSVLTLALFEDTGWYKVDWSWATPLNFGKGAGCAFHTDSCITSSGQPAFDEFCVDTERQQKCDYNNLHTGQCGIATHRNGGIPPEFQWFPDTPDKGGTDAWLDYCPVIEAYSNRSCRGTTPSYKSPYIGETIGFNSKCIEGTIAPKHRI
jgi:leishmanolysin